MASKEPQFLVHSLKNRSKSDKKTLVNNDLNRIMGGQPYGASLHEPQVNTPRPRAHAAKRAPSNFPPGESLSGYHHNAFANPPGHGYFKVPTAFMQYAPADFRAQYTPTVRDDKRVKEGVSTAEPRNKTPKPNQNLTKKEAKNKRIENNAKEDKKRKKKEEKERAELYSQKKRKT